MDLVAANAVAEPVTFLREDEGDCVIWMGIWARKTGPRAHMAESRARLGSNYAKPKDRLGLVLSL